MKNLDAFIKAMDKEVLWRAERSWRTPGTMPIVEQIIDVMVQKKHLINLKLDLERLVDKLPNTLRRRAEAYFIKGQPTTRICLREGVADRTVFRSLNEVVKFIARRLPSIGINTFTFNQLKKDYWWIDKEYQMQIEPPPEKMVLEMEVEEDLESHLDKEMA